MSTQTIQHVGEGLLETSGYGRVEQNPPTFRIVFGKHETLLFLAHEPRSAYEQAVGILQAAHRVYDEALADLVATGATPYLDLRVRSISEDLA